MNRPIIQRGLLRGEVAIPRTRLTQYQRTEQAHDHYLRSVRIIGTGAEGMRTEAEAGNEYARGWLACLRLFALTITGSDRQ